MSDINRNCRQKNLKGAIEKQMNDLDLVRMALDLQEQIDSDEKEDLKLHNSEILNFIEYAKEHGLVIINENISSPYTIGVIVESDKILNKLIPTLSPDKEGLYSWTDISNYFANKDANGFLIHEKFMAMLHPFFRRKLSSGANFAPGFITTMMHDGQLQGQELSVALDENRLRINVDDTFYVEFDTWYGPKFQIDIENLQDGPVKLAPPTGCNPLLYDYYFVNVKFLDISWTSYPSVREFQLEEVKEENIKISINNEVFHPVRYIHAEFDTTLGCFRHLDGAIHLYSKDEYNVRICGNLNNNVQNLRNTIKPASVKLFKINGSIPVAQFISYCSLFLTQDPLIHEYFTGKLPNNCVEAVKKLTLKT